MKQIDRLVLKEIVGPWAFGVALFTALVMAATYLNKIADLIVSGAPPDLILRASALLFPAILAKTFTMAVLLAAILAFGRLSSDSEIVALRAGGASVFRIVRPVMIFSVLIAVATFAFNEAVVPRAADEAKRLLNELADRNQKRDGVPVSFPIASEGKMQAQIVARAFNAGARTMSGVTIVTYDEEGAAEWYVSVPEMVYQNQSSWEWLGTTRIVSADGTEASSFQGARPEFVPSITKSPADILIQSNNDPDILSMGQIRAEVDRAKRDGDLPKARVANLEYWYWNKIAVPLAAFIFGTLGAVLGIRNHRTGNAAGMALAIAIIFGYQMLANFMSVWAQGGVFPSYVASFLPLILGTGATGIIMWRRNA